MNDATPTDESPTRALLEALTEVARRHRGAIVPTEPADVCRRFGIIAEVAMADYLAEVDGGAVG